MDHQVDVNCIYQDLCGMGTCGERIRFLRKRANLKRSDLARMIGVSPPTIGNWEDHGARPHPKRLPLLASVLRTTQEFLITGMGDPSGPSHDCANSEGSPCQDIASFLPKGGGLQEIINSARVAIAAAAGVDKSNIRIQVEY